MVSLCPYICNNKTEYGYCKTSGCINPKFAGDIFHLNNSNIFPNEAREATFRLYAEFKVIRDGGENGTDR